MARFAIVSLKRVIRLFPTRQGPALVHAYKEGIKVVATRCSVATLSLGAQVHQPAKREQLAVDRDRETAQRAFQRQLVRVVALAGFATKLETWSTVLMR